MRDYELTLVVDPDLTSEKQKKLITQIKKIITDLKGKVEKTDEWGKRELTYPVKKKTLGYYFLLVTKLPEDAPGQVDQKLRLEEGVIRYLLVKREKREKKREKPASTKVSAGKGGRRGAKVAQ